MKRLSRLSTFFSTLAPRVFMSGVTGGGGGGGREGGEGASPTGSHSSSLLEEEEDEDDEGGGVVGHRGEEEEEEEEESSDSVSDSLTERGGREGVGVCGCELFTKGICWYTVGCCFLPN